MASGGYLDMKPFQASNGLSTSLTGTSAVSVKSSLTDPRSRRQVTRAHPDFARNGTKKIDQDQGQGDLHRNGETGPSPRPEGVQ